MKYIYKLFLIFISFFIFCPNLFSFTIQSDKAILINLNDNSIIYNKNENEKTSVASLTKMMTAIVAIENIEDLNEKVYITNEDWKGLIENNASVAGYVRYRNYTYEDLLYGLMLPSGADCANALSRLIGGNIPDFVKMMNEKAKELGLNDTNFANPTGLDDKNNYSTASDMAKLLKYGIENETFKKIIITMKYEASDGTKLEHTINKYSKMKNISIQGLQGGKTGSTDDAGVCLASIAEYNDVSYLLVVLNADFPNQLLDTKTIYEYYMNNYKYQTLINKGDILTTLDTKYTKEKQIDILSEKDYSYYLTNDYEKNNMVIEYDGITTITHNMKKNDKLGTITIYYNQELKEEIDIYLDKDMKFDLISFITYNITYFIISIIILIISTTIIIIIKKHKNKPKNNLSLNNIEIL